MDFHGLIGNLVGVVREHAGWFVGGSLLTIVVGLVLVPALIIRLPADYFRYQRRYAVLRRHPHPVARMLLTGGKNVLGAAFIVSGFALFFLPGQGLLTLVAGLVIMNYPGKFAFERWLVRRPHVLPALNWLRRRYGRDPLLTPNRKS